MNLLSYRAFSTELLKIANDLGDAEIRALLAERNGEEYLEGGELETNDSDGETKTANYAMAAPGLLKARKKEEGAYQTVRDTGIKTLGGAAAGAGSMKLVHDMSKKVPGHLPTARAYRLSAGIGAGVALADKVFRHRQDIKNSVRRKPKVKVAIVQQNPNASFRSPADALASSSNVGKFHDKQIHQSAAQVPGLLGKPAKAHTL